MLPFLFRRLTRGPKPGQAAFERIVAEARQRHWFLEGQVPDTLNGRFAVLATIAAVAIARLEREGEDPSHSAAVTERFVQAMDAEHREMGLNDPGLGRRVRKLVGSLARRVEAVRAAAGGDTGWKGAVEECLYRDCGVDAAAVDHSGEALRQLSQRLNDATSEAVMQGQF